jgi:hypothetical protein
LGKQECQNPANIGAWLPMLRALLPGLLAQCNAARKLAEDNVKNSLQTHMFAGRFLVSVRALLRRLTTSDALTCGASEI